MTLTLVLTVPVVDLVLPVILWNLIMTLMSTHRGFHTCISWFTYKQHSFAPKYLPWFFHFSFFFYNDTFTLF